MGNMTTFGSGSRTVNAQNELTSGPFTPGYDADGNLISGLPAVSGVSNVSLSLVYDAWNDVIGVKNVSNVSIETFLYDANGRRYQSTLSAYPYTQTNTTFSAAGQAERQCIGGRMPGTRRSLKP